MLKNNLQICDKSATEESIKQLFLNSLPRCIRQYIGNDEKNCADLESVYRLAEKACEINKPRKNQISENSIEMNSMYTSNNNTSSSYDDYDEETEFDENQDVQHIWFLAQHIRNKKFPMQKQEVDCWHCGAKGHFAGECRTNQAGLPQTASGAFKHAAFNKMRGDNRPYDAKAQIDRSAKFKLRQAQYQKTREAVEGNEDVEDTTSFKRNRPSKFGPGARKLIPNVSSSSKSKSNADSSETIDLGAHIVEIHEEDEDFSDEEEYDNGTTEGPKKIVFVLNTYHTHNHQQILEIEKKETSTATSLCLPLEINGTAISYALCDQGATRTVMRGSAVDRLDLDVNEFKVKNHFVLCSSGEEIPIRSRFKAAISSGGKSIGESLVYVVSDLPEADIICDMVLGRSSLASSKYNCIDTQAGTIFNKLSGDSIQCQPAQFIETSHGKHVVPRTSNRRQ